MDTIIVATLAATWGFNWGAVASIAAVCTLLAVLWQARSAKNEARTARTIKCLERFESSWNNLQETKSYHLGRAGEEDYLKFPDARAAANNLFRLFEEILVYRAHGVLNTDLFDDQLDRYNAELSMEFVLFTEKLPPIREWYPRVREYFESLKILEPKT